MSDQNFTLGAHSAQIEALSDRLTSVETTVRGMDRKLDTVLIGLAEKAGERKMFLTVASVVGGTTGLIATLLVQWFSQK